MKRYAVLILISIMTLLVLVCNYDEVTIKILNWVELTGKYKVTVPFNPPNLNIFEPLNNVRLALFPPDQCKITLISRLVSPESEVKLNIFRDDRFLCALLINKERPVVSQEIFLSKDSKYASARLYIVANIKYLSGDAEKQEEVRNLIVKDFENKKQYAIHLSRNYYNDKYNIYRQDHTDKFYYEYNYDGAIIRSD